MKKLVSVLSLVALIAGSAGIAAAAPGHGGGGFHGGGGAHGGGGFHGHAGFHGHDFHRGFHGRTFVGVAPFFWDPYPGYVAPPVYTTPAPSDYWYYCPSAGGYYPYVSSCPETWVPVPSGG